MSDITNSSGNRKPRYIYNPSRASSGSRGGESRGNQEPDRQFAEPVEPSDSGGNSSQASPDRAEPVGNSGSPIDSQRDTGGSGEAPRDDSQSGSGGNSGRARGNPGRASNTGRSGKTRGSSGRASSQKEEPFEIPRDSVKRPKVIDFDSAKTARQFAIKMEDLSKILLTGSSVVAKFAGEHWEFTNSEATELAKALKALPVGKDSWIIKFLSKNQPYFNFLLVAGSIFAPRAFISYQLARQQGQQGQQHAHTQQQSNSQESQEFSHGSAGQGWTPNSNGSWYQNLSTATG